MTQKLDILVICAHPDDAELCCGGTLIKHADRGYKTGIVDLTHGEMGTRGTVETRAKEALEANKILNVNVRETWNLRDGWIDLSEANKLEVIKIIRKYQPKIVLTNAPVDRHPDHGNAAELVRQSAFLAGLIKIETNLEGEKQLPWRPEKVYHFVQYYNLKPDFVVDISGYEDRKMAAIQAYKSQFYNPNSNEPETLIASKHFLEMMRARLLIHGNDGGIASAEGFNAATKPAVDELFDLL